MKLSIIIPVYNEEKTVVEILKRVTELQIPQIIKEVIVVDDGSTDATVAKIKSQKYLFSKSEGLHLKELTFIQHEHNKGKGAAIKTGIEKANGEYIIIQDADLEYNPLDIVRLIGPIQRHKADVVYGTRLKRMPHLKDEENHWRFFLHYLGNKFLSFLTSILYGQWITDMETCYKLFPRKALDTITLRARSFDFEPEITAKLLKLGYKIHEVPISTKPRNYHEGKKLNTFRDGSIAIWTLLKYRFIN